jgi:replicative DNA helicase
MPTVSVEGRLPPYSEEAERAVLGSLLLEAERVWAVSVHAGLTYDAFYVPAHQLVFRAADWLHRAGKCIDVLTVADALKQHGHLDSVGGQVYLERLIEGTPTAAHAEYYADIVKQKWTCRRLESINQQTAEAIRRGDEPAELLATQIAAMTELHQGRKRYTKQTAWERVRQSCLDAKEGKMPGLPSPWDRFNRFVGGAPYGLVTLVAGRSKTRKSYIVHQWGLWAAVEQRAQIPGVYFPLEDGQRVAMLRAACLMSGVNPWKYMRGHVDAEQMEAVDYAAKKIIASPYEIAGGRGMGFPELRLEVAKGVAKHGWKFCIIDAFKDLGNSEAEGWGEEMLSKAICDMADKHEIAVIVVHHVRKKLSDDRSEFDKEEQYIGRDDIRGRARIVDDARMVNILQCKMVRGVDMAIKYVDYMLDCVCTNHGPTAAMPLTVDEATGKFIENPDGARWGGK